MVFGIENIFNTSISLISCIENYNIQHAVSITACVVGVVSVPVFIFIFVDPKRIANIISVLRFKEEYTGFVQKSSHI